MTRIVEIELVSSAGKLSKLPPAGLPEIAFAGRSNVGKSSLLNALSGRRSLFKVSKAPGRTRTIVHAKARLDGGGEIYLVDLPGFGHAEVAREATRAWRALIEGFLADRPTLVLVVLLVDVRRGPEEEEAALVEYLAAHRIPALLVATKTDRVPSSKRKTALMALRRDTGIAVLGTSAKTREGVDRLVALVARAAGFGEPAPQPPR